MGGGQANKQQAAQANAAANSSEQQSASLSNTNQQQQGQLNNYLFGSGGPGSGTGGSLTPMMNPASLNVTQPTGAYKAQLNNTENQLNQNFNNQRGSLAQTWANNGFAAGMPNGFQADAMRQLSRDQADANGQAFASTVGQQYQDSLNNFWNANNIASGQLSGARSGALQGAQQEGSTATGIYGTAGQYHQGALQSVGTAFAGGVGSSLCPARGSMVALRGGHEKPVEDLEIGDDIAQVNNTSHRLEHKPVPALAKCVTVITADLRRTTVSREHAFDMYSGGYVEAHEALHRRIRVREGYDVVIAVRDAGEQEVFLMKVGGNHTYLCDGLWSLD